MKKRSYPDTLCAYCAVNPATTKDHIFPKCLFFPPRPNNLVTVPACEACNHKFALDQDYLRDYLITDARVQNHPTVHRLIAGPLASAVATNRSSLARAAQAHAQQSGDIRNIPIDAPRIYALLQMMVRGAYYYLFAERLPADYKVLVVPTDPNDPDAPLKIQERTKGLGMQRMTKWGEHGDVIAALDRFPDEDIDPGITYGVMIFYLGIYFEVVTCPPTEDAHIVYEAVRILAQRGLLAMEQETNKTND